MARMPFVCKKLNWRDRPTAILFHGTCEVRPDLAGGFIAEDFRHEDGTPAELPGRAMFQLDIPLQERA